MSRSGGNGWCVSFSSDSLCAARLMLPVSNLRRSHLSLLESTSLTNLARLLPSPKSSLQVSLEARASPPTSPTRMARGLSSTQGLQHPCRHLVVELKRGERREGVSSLSYKAVCGFPLTRPFALSLSQGAGSRAKSTTTEATPELSSAAASPKPAPQPRRKPGRPPKKKIVEEPEHLGVGVAGAGPGIYLG
jgi:hypothetical protein